MKKGDMELSCVDAYEQHGHGVLGKHVHTPTPPHLITQEEKAERERLEKEKRAKQKQKAKEKVKSEKERLAAEREAERKAAEERKAQEEEARKQREEQERYVGVRVVVWCVVCIHTYIFILMSTRVLFKYVVRTGYTYGKQHMPTVVQNATTHHHTTHIITPHHIHPTHPTPHTQSQALGGNRTHPSRGGGTHGSPQT